MSTLTEARLDGFFFTGRRGAGSTDGAAFGGAVAPFAVAPFDRTFPFDSLEFDLELELDAFKFIVVITGVIAGDKTTGDTAGDGIGDP
jgi:hypothetical protein